MALAPANFLQLCGIRSTVIGRSWVQLLLGEPSMPVSLTEKLIYQDLSWFYFFILKA